MNTLDRLQRWYLGRCDGKWERSGSLVLDTLDNPGWTIKVSLPDLGIKLADPAIFQSRTEHDWVAIQVVEDRLRVACGPRNLREAIDCFLGMIDVGEVGTALRQGNLSGPSDTLERLQEWYLSHCDGDWEHGDNFRIDTTAGWSLAVDVADLGVLLDDPNIVERRSDHDWILVRVEDGWFRASGGQMNLRGVIERFLEFAPSGTMELLVT